MLRFTWNEKVCFGDVALLKLCSLDSHSLLTWTVVQHHWPSSVWKWAQARIVHGAEGSESSSLKSPLQATSYFTFSGKVIFASIQWPSTNKLRILTSGQTYHGKFYMDSIWGACSSEVWEAIPIGSYIGPLGGTVIPCDYSCLTAWWPTSSSHRFPIFGCQG